MRQKPANKVRRRQFVLLLMIVGALFGMIFLFSLSPVLSEWYMRGVYPVMATVLSFVSALFPFSLYDLFLIVVVLLLLKMIVWAIIRKTSFLKFLYLLIRFVAIIVAWFYFSWGIAYFRKDFHGRSDVPQMAFDPEVFREFATRFIEDANRFYVDGACRLDSDSATHWDTDSLDVNGKDHLATNVMPTRFYVNDEDMDREKVRRKIESSYQALRQPLKIAYPNGRRRVKPMMFESVYTKMGISGYFGPFFNEIHVNNFGLDFSYPFTLAHEMAHQFGVATESEANLYAFIVCTHSNDKSIRYSAYASTLAYVLNDIRRFLPDEYKQLVSSIRPEIIADLQRNRKHWLGAMNESLSEAQGRVYDAYLKTNKVSSGQANYSEVVGLLVSSFGKI